MSIKKALLRFDEVQLRLGGCSRDHIYDLLAAGKLRAHNPNGRPRSRGTRIISESVDDYLSKGEIPASAWGRDKIR